MRVCVRNKKSIKILEKAYYLTSLRLQVYSAPLQIIQCAKFGACAIGWPSLVYIVYTSHSPLTPWNASLFVCLRLGNCMHTKTNICTV